MEEEKTAAAGIRARGKILLQWLLAGTAALGIALTVQKFAYSQSIIHNISMQDTLFEGQRIVEDKWSYRFHRPERGDIVIINGPESELRLIKRIIGLPGEQIDFKDGTVWIDGRPLNEPYAKGLTTADGLSLPYTIAEDRLFVMGDNRENSLDSRMIGTVALSSIEGKAVLRIWPFRQFGKLQ